LARGPKLVLGKESKAGGGAQQKFQTRAQGPGIARSECPVEMG